MTEEQTPTLTRERVHLIGARTIQSHYLLQEVSNHVSATLHESIDEALSLAYLDGTAACVLLIDVTYIPVTRFLEITQRTGIPENVSPALFNVPRDEQSLANWVLSGVRGAFFEDNSIEHVVRGIRALLDGSIWVSRETLLAAAVGPHHEAVSEQRESSAGNLTRREQEILGILCIGASNKEIAEKLFISANTVKTHIYNIYKKLNVPNRMQAALWGAKHL